MNVHNIIAHVFLPKECFDIVLSCLASVPALLLALCTVLRFFLPLVVSDDEIDRLPELHFADVCHRQASFESCEDDVIESD